MEDANVTCVNSNLKEQVDIKFSDAVSNNTSEIAIISGVQGHNMKPILMNSPPVPPIDNMDSSLPSITDEKEDVESTSFNDSADCNDLQHMEHEQMSSTYDSSFMSDFSKTSDSSFQDVENIEFEIPKSSSSCGIIIKEEHRGMLDGVPANMAYMKRVRRRRPGFYQKVNASDDPETLKEKRRKYNVELKMKNLKWTLNQPSEVTGPRQKRPPQRLDLGHPSRRPSVDYGLGNGEPLCTIPWVIQQIKDAKIYTLRLLHRVMFRKQGMFSEKHLKSSILSFQGFPFQETSLDYAKRRDVLEKANVNILGSLCDMLGVKCFTRNEMIEGILKFLLNPSRSQVEEFLKDVVANREEHQKVIEAYDNEHCMEQRVPIPKSLGKALKEVEFEDSSNGSFSPCEEDNKNAILGQGIDITNSVWKKPSFFCEGCGLKLKLIKPIMCNIISATDYFIELLHKAMFANTDEKYNMRRNVLEFSGFPGPLDVNDSMLRSRLLTMLPLKQIKFICRILCLPTWHRSRQQLVETIMDFLARPRLSALKKRLPSSAPDSMPYSCDSSASYLDPKNFFQGKNMESEEIEIFPDIHIPDEAMTNSDKDFLVENNEETEVKLKHFSNIHYQVISTPAAKLNDVHMILYFRPCPPNHVRKNILEFSGFPFNEESAEFQCRRALMEQMTMETLLTIAKVFCVSQYIFDKTRSNIVEAVLKFLLRPSLLWKGSTPPPVYIPCVPNNVVKHPNAASVANDCQKIFILTPPPKMETSTFPSKIPGVEFPVILTPNIVQTSLPGCTVSKDSTIVSIPTAAVPAVATIQEMEPKPVTISESKETQPKPAIKDTPSEMDEPLAKVQTKAKSSCSNHHSDDDDDDDDEPLSNLVGHPNDDQLKLLVAKIIKESKLENITMKQVVRMVFSNYANFDLNYRKEFIKSTVRQILSQMDEQSCSVSTTVLTV